MIILSPMVLIIFGLIMDLFGALLISIEAFGAKELVTSMTCNDKIASKKTEIGFTATINQIFIFVLVWIICIIILLLFVQQFGITLDFIVAPFGYFVWRLLVKISHRLYSFVASFKPGRFLSKRRSIIVRILQLILIPIWALFLTVLGLIAIAIRFLLEIPLCWVSEKIIRIGIERIFQRIAVVEKEMQKWHFKKIAFIGALLLVGGFIYQIIGTVLLLLNVE